MVGESLALCDGDAGIGRAFEELLWMADAGEGENFTSLQRFHRAMVRHQTAMQHR